MKTQFSETRNYCRVLLALVISLGLLYIPAIAWSNVYAQVSEVPTPTDTPFKFSSSGNCGVDYTKLYLQIQYQNIRSERSIKEALCGRLVILQDKKTKKDLLGFMPCNKGGGPYIFATRPRELLDYYQLVNAKIKKGKKIFIKDYGVINKYIQTFETYYPLDQCSSCGTVSLPGSKPVFIFPGQVPSATPIPTLQGNSNLAGKWLGIGLTSSRVAGEFVFPTAHSPVSQELVSSTTTSNTAAIVERSPSATAIVNSLPEPEATATLTHDIAPTSTPANLKIAGPVKEIKPPTEKPLLSALGYSLYTFLLIPLIIFLIIWRRSRFV